MVKFVDVARFYIGCKVFVKTNKDGEFIATFAGLEPMYGNSFKMLRLTNAGNNIPDDSYVNFCICKPILKPLSDIDKDTLELIHNTTSDIKLSNSDCDIKYSISVNPLAIDILTKNGYDLFNLIESGEALNNNNI